MLDNNLRSDCNIDKVFKKSQRCLLQFVSENSPSSCLIRPSGQCFINLLLSLFSLSPLSAGISISRSNTNVLDEAVDICSKIIGSTEESLQDLYNKQLYKKAISIQIVPILYNCYPPKSSTN